MKKSFWSLLFLLVSLSVRAQEHHSPYAMQQDRQIKAISVDEVRDYLEGRGMGLAKAAELNQYPGPLHVLEVAERLQLSNAQRERIEEVRKGMLREAKELGGAIVERELELDRLFAGRKIGEGRLRTLVGEIARLQGELRVAHLRAHLEMRKVLTPEQIERYDELRGYRVASVPDDKHQRGEP